MKAIAILKKQTIITFCIYLLCVFNGIEAIAQSIEFSCGLNSNKFYNLHNDYAPYNYSIYTSQTGIYVGVSIEDLTIDSFPIHISLIYETVGGTASVRTGGLGGGRSLKVATDKSLISLSLTPFKLKVYKQLNIKLGPVFSILLNETFRGTKSESAGAQQSTIDLQKIGNSFNSKVYLGFQARISYDIPLNYNFALSFQYHYYIGLLNEFQESPRNSKSMRHSLGIGIKKNL